MIKIFQGLFDSNDKQINKIQKYVDEINLLEKDISKLSDTKLKEKTEYFRKQLGVNLDTARKDFNTNSSEQLKWEIPKTSCSSSMSSSSSCGRGKVTISSSI